MALEDLTGTKYLDDLVATNPAAGDNVSEGDDHIRGIKNVLKLSFPGIDGAVNATDTELNLIDGGTARGTDALASGDGILINDAGVMKMTNVDTVQTFMQVESLLLAGGAMSGNITMAGSETVDGRDLSVDGTKLDAIEASADVTDAGNVGTVVVGKQTIWIPAAAITPTKSNGCAARTQVETTAGRPDMDVLDFDTSADEHAQFSVAFPKMWNLGTVTFQVFWCSTATDTDGVAWGLQGVSMPDNSTIDVPYGTAIVVTDDAQSAAEELYVTAESGAVTIAGTPADNDLCYFRVLRDISDGNDDMTEDARLIGIKLFYTTDALNDA